MAGSHGGETEQRARPEERPPAPRRAPEGRFGLLFAGAGLALASLALVETLRPELAGGLAPKLLWLSGAALFVAAGLSGLAGLGPPRTEGLRSRMRAAAVEDQLRRVLAEPHPVQTLDWLCQRTRLSREEAREGLEALRRRGELVEQAGAGGESHFWIPSLPR